MSLNYFLFHFFEKVFEGRSSLIFLRFNIIFVNFMNKVIFFCDECIEWIKINFQSTVLKVRISNMIFSILLALSLKVMRMRWIIMDVLHCLCKYLSSKNLPLTYLWDLFSFSNSVNCLNLLIFFFPGRYLLFYIHWINYRNLFFKNILLHQVNQLSFKHFNTIIIM